MKRLLPLALAALLPLTACDDDTRRGIAPDAVAPSDAEDVSADDTAPPPAEPLAQVYPNNPIQTPETEQVLLTNLTDPDGHLVGHFARVRNCVPDLEAGAQIPFDLGPLVLTITACDPRSVAVPGADGTYLDIAPPASRAEDDGRFAEVMMYHHMQVIHAYFSQTHGLTDRDHALDAIVNIQAHLDLCDEWGTLPNAAFVPAEALDQLPLGLDFGLQGDAIVFSGSETKNFAFDAGVIYHEYVHAILGNTRLRGTFVDRRGLNNLPGALNEAYADYFATTILDQSVLGRYSLDDIGPARLCGFDLGGSGNFARDLGNDFVCPDDLTAAIHSDSELFSAALWELRAAFGAEDADRVVLAAVLTLTDTSDFTIAAEATIDKAFELLGADAEATARAVFEARNLVDCDRVLPAARVGARGRAISLPSTSQLGALASGGYAPGFVQYRADVPAGARQLTVELDVAAAGGLFGGGGELALELALRPDGAPITYTPIGPAQLSHDATVTPTVPADGRLTFDESCLGAGSLVFAIHNRGGDAGLSRVTVESSDEPAGEGAVACGD